MICPSCGHDNIEGMDRCDNCMKSLRDLDVPRPDAARGLVRSVMEDDLRKLEREETVTVSPSTPAIEVVRRMKEAQAGCALVVDEGELVGIFTEHDVLCKMTGANARGTADVAVSELMSANPESLRETDSVAAALNKMALGRYRHVPVLKTDGGYTVSSIKHVLKFIAQEDW
jgi:CBS domain-containing protein